MNIRIKEEAELNFNDWYSRYAGIVFDVEKEDEFYKVLKTVVNSEKLVPKDRALMKEVGLFIPTNLCRKVRTFEPKTSNEHIKISFLLRIERWNTYVKMFVRNDGCRFCFYVELKAINNHIVIPRRICINISAHTAEEVSYNNLSNSTINIAFSFGN